MRIALDRAAILFALWMVLIRSVHPADLAVGASTGIAPASRR